MVQSVGIEGILRARDVERERDEILAEVATVKSRVEQELGGDAGFPALVSVYEARNVNLMLKSDYPRSNVRPTRCKIVWTTSSLCARTCSSTLTKVRPGA